ncbi:MAG TPA: hypothetical protein VFP94_05965 [Terriglobales bacterium]|nr:hypothetical protein [Terriglobales bacterium]
MLSIEVETKVADEAWIAVATLHREHPEAEDFSVEEAVERATALGFTRPGVKQHIMQHAVANKPPNPGRYRMLRETAPGRRRLYYGGDPCHPDREGAKTAPLAEDLPSRWQKLLTWYQGWKPAHSERGDPLLELWGTGSKVWGQEHADAYVERMRRGWK